MILSFENQQSNIMHRQIFNKFSFSQVNIFRGKPETVGTRDVRLRGVHLQANVRDAPTLIFFPEVFDKVENWIPFFTNPEYGLLNSRNIYILYQRNIGSSDRCGEEMNYPEMANDVVRFMWENKITSATLAGHGLGGKLAIATGCYHPERVTGIIGLDSCPMDQTYVQPYQELNSYLKSLKQVDLNKGFTHLTEQLKDVIKDPKWRSIFHSQLTKEGGRFSWNFDLDYLHRNLSSKQTQSLLNWPRNMGLWTGRTQFLFPDYSRYVHLGTNTIAMYKTCIQLRSYNQDIFSIPGDENPLNHWIYEFEDNNRDYAIKMKKFLDMYDGVNVLLNDRSEVGVQYIPDRRSMPKGFRYNDIRPGHLHHNWRYSQDPQLQEARK